nr:FecR domain-containing protein [uncultured Cohaesibacter sp.]
MRRILFVLVFFLILPLQTHAQSSASWTVQKITGVAYIAQKGQKAIKVRKGSVLHPGQTLSTENRTRLLLVRGKERIQVGSGAIMAIPPAKYIQPGKTLILQQSGRLQLTVNKKDVKHFAVKTPYLTAVVKGTVFTVEVARNRSEVSVNRGRVEVSDGATGNTTEITRGQKAAVARAATGKTEMTVQAKGKKPTIRQIKAKVTKPNFYATVQVKGKIMALKPGSKAATTSVKDVRSEVTAAASPASRFGNRNKAGKSNNTSSNNGSSNNGKSNTSSNSSSNNGKSSASSNASSNNGKSNASSNGKSNASSNASSNNGKSSASSNASSNNGKSNASSNASSNNGKSSKNK